MPAKKPDDQTRSSVVRLRLTPGELEALTASAKARGVSLSVLLRHMVLGAVLPKAPAPKVDQDTYLALSRIGNNLNQIARRINSPHEAIPGSNEIQTRLAELDEALKRVRLGVLK